jgi:hypothetical protein
LLEAGGLEPIGFVDARCAWIGCGRRSRHACVRRSSQASSQVPGAVKQVVPADIWVRGLILVWSGRG